MTDGVITLEVKSAGYMQAWQQEGPSVISFPIEQRVATAYVFCLLAEQDPELVDPQNLSQWRFWVVPTARLHAERKSIGMQPLIRAYGEGIVMTLTSPTYGSVNLDARNNSTPGYTYTGIYNCLPASGLTPVDFVVGEDDTGQTLIQQTVRASIQVLQRRSLAR